VVFDNLHLKLKVENYPVVFCAGDGIGIRVGLRSQILRVRVSPGAPRTLVFTLFTLSKVGIAVSITARCLGSTARPALHWRLEKSLGRRIVQP
jgi:hypothetical protein